MRWFWPPRAQSQANERWPLSMPLARFSNSDYWRLSDAVMGSILLGSTGSGKSSGASRVLLLALLRAGLGGLMLCVKDERKFIEDCARLCGRSQDLVIFSPDRPFKMNLLHYELNAGGGSRLSRLENGVQLFKIILELSERGRQGESGSSDNKYFERAALQLLRCILVVLILAGTQVTLQNIHSMIMSVALTLDEAASNKWRDESYCYRMLKKADDASRTASETLDFEQALLYLMRELPAMDAKPRSSIISTYTTMSDLLQRGNIRDTFFSETNIVPEACRKGAIIVLDYPILRWNETGRIIQSAFKFIWQRAQERYDSLADPTPVFLLSDEFHQCLNSYDATFQSSCRSSRVCTLYATQNLPALYEAVGGEKGRNAIDALLGNLRLKLLHGQDCVTTCRWQSELIGKTKRLLFNSNSQRNDEPFDVWRPKSSVSAGFSESWEEEIPPWEWAHGLRSGGRENNYLVDCIAYQGGRVWNANGKTYLPVSFDQREG